MYSGDKSKSSTTCATSCVIFKLVYYLLFYDNLSKVMLFSFFRCFVGNDVEMTVEDCLLRPHILTHYQPHPHEISRSVSEMKEWVCAKTERPDGTLIRDCMSMYTGGMLNI